MLFWLIVLIALTQCLLKTGDPDLDPF